MVIAINKYNGEEMLFDCDGFEFRTNHVSNWIKIKKGDSTELIHGIATIKNMEAVKCKGADQHGSEKGVLEKIAESQRTLSDSIKAWNDHIEKYGDIN